ncbi:MAG: hypothetical protein COA79_24190 [Planctomycetota bacterium]|nr:MAG: hypothetical protein COA79_24190 [Planctomycetota bacterium]
MVKRTLPAQPVSGLIDGFASLQAVLAAGEPIGCREIGRRCDLNRTRANRLLGTWRHLGMVQQNEEDKYEPGPALFTMAGMSLHSSPILRCALPLAQRWWKDGFCVSLGIRWQDRINFILHANPNRPFLESIGGRPSDAAVRSSAGLASLAQTTKLEIKKYDCEKQWQEQGDGCSFETVLSHVHNHGFATRTYSDSTRSVGVALKDSPAAFAVSKKHLSAKQARHTAKDLINDIAELVESIKVAEKNTSLEFKPINA